MPGPDMKGVKVESQAFTLWKQKEAREGRITIERVIEETGLAKLTVRRFLAREGDVSGSTLGSAAIMAKFLDANLCEMVSVIEVNEEAPAEKEEAAA